MSSERLNLDNLPEQERVSNPEGVVGNPMSYAPYRLTYIAVNGLCLPDYPVPDDLRVSIIGNNTLLPNTFRLRDFDKSPLNKVQNPGKSAQIAHTDRVVVACLTMLGRYAKREDHLYTLEAGLLLGAGFSAIYSPTKKHPLHIRITPHRLEDGDTPEESRQLLAELLQRFKID